MWTIKDLFDTINDYMYNKVDGDDFELEQDFEDAIRDLLEEACFNVLPKKNVENTQKMIAERRVYGTVEDQIPDIAILCEDGLVFLELKLRATPQEYDEDIQKVNTYEKLGKCKVGGVLFLSEVQRQGWTTCQANKSYCYLF